MSASHPSPQPRLPIRIITLQAPNDSKRYKDFWLSGVERYGTRCFRISAEDEVKEPFPTQSRDDSFTLAAVASDSGVAVVDATTAPLLGVVSFRPESTNRSLLAHKGLLLRMYVSPSAEGGGVGRALIEELIRRVRENCPHIRQINLTVVASNTRAKKLYEKIGFVEYGLERDSVRREDGTFADESLMRFFIQRDSSKPASVAALPTPLPSAAPSTSSSSSPPPS